MVSFKFKKLDIHLKVLEGVYQQSLLGALLTLLSVAIVFYLLFSEISTYMQTDVVSRMVTDSSIENENIRIFFDLEFDKIGCSFIEFSQEVTRGSTHTHEPEKISKNSTFQGCQVTGVTVTDKVGGNIKFGVSASLKASGQLIDLSHKVKYVVFLPDDKELFMGNEKYAVSYPLNGRSSDTLPGMGLHYYSIQIVPTEYETLRGEIQQQNQYSISDQQIPFDHAIMGVSITNQFFKDFLGVVFSYDFYPIKLKLEERKESIFDFLANLCGIIGGVITILALLERCLHQSTKALIGKKD